MATQLGTLYDGTVSLSTRICILLSLVLIVAGAQDVDSDSRIVGGEETTIGGVPYIVNLRQNGRFICGGTLVTARCVLTAAHCVFGTPPSDLTVHAGASRLSEPSVNSQVEQHFVSPFFSPDTLDMDVAILKLADELSGENIATVPVCTHAPGTNQLVKISGWGYTEENRPIPSDQVRTANVRIVPRLDCIKAYTHTEHITSTMFCATVPGTKDACSGDSGGPMIYDGELCGIVSWGVGCARPEYPGVYTNVASLRIKHFVKKTLQQHCI